MLFSSHTAALCSEPGPLTAVLASTYLGPNHNYTKLFYILLTVQPCIIYFKLSQPGAHYFLVYLFQLLCMFRATMCPSSGETTVFIFIRHLLLVILYGRLSGMQEHMLPHTRRPPIQSEKYRCRIFTVSSPDDGEKLK